MRESLKFLPMSFDLATIRKDLDLKDNLDSLKKKEPEKQKLLHIFKELEFKTWTEELLESKGVNFLRKTRSRFLRNIMKLFSLR